MVNMIDISHCFHYPMPYCPWLVWNMGATTYVHYNLCGWSWEHSNLSKGDSENQAESWGASWTHAPPKHTLSSGRTFVSLHSLHGWHPVAWPHDPKGLLGWCPAPGPCYPIHGEILEVTLEILWESNSLDLGEVVEGKNRERYNGEGWEDGKSHKLLQKPLFHGLIFFSNKKDMKCLGQMFRANVHSEENKKHI